MFPKHHTCMFWTISGMVIPPNRNCASPFNLLLQKWNVLIFLHAKLIDVLGCSGAGIGAWARGWCLSAFRSWFSCLMNITSPDQAKNSTLPSPSRSPLQQPLLDGVAWGFFIFNIKEGQNKCNYSSIMKFVSVVNVLSYVEENPDTDELKTDPRQVVKESWNFFSKT